jgi:5'-nucleotidase (lipoprotein e(P4) family)
MSLIEQSHRKAGILALLLLSLSCSQAVSAQAPTTTNQSRSDTEYLEGAVLWQQTSGERRALSYQAFALARMMLDRDLRLNRRNRRQRAIIVDLDETILDNSRNEARIVKQGVPFTPDSFTAWVNRAECDAVPGAVEFLRYANARRVRVFYVSNRKQIERDGTARNLKKLGFPNVNDETLLLRPEAGEMIKEPRRVAVSARYRVVLLMGDDLNDFAAVFENSKTVESRIEATERNKDQFGTRFIMLPNPMYGNWESAIYGYNLKLPEAEKAAKRRSVLKAY